MVEVSNLYDLDIYTIAGQYVGRVVDVVLNIRMGTISKLQVRALEPENKNVGIRDIFRNGLQFVPEENEMRSFQEGVLNVDFDKVRAIGDIMLIDPQDIERQVPTPPQNQPQAKTPNQDPQKPM
jgi:sporulation protein YlmC with PRC-barrel domain